MDTDHAIKLPAEWAAVNEDIVARLPARQREQSILTLMTQQPGYWSVLSDKFDEAGIRTAGQLLTAGYDQIIEKLKIPCGRREQVKVLFSMFGCPQITG